MVWQIRCRIAACVACRRHRTQVRRTAARMSSSRSTRLCATAAHSTSASVSSVSRRRIQHAGKHVGEAARRRRPAARRSPALAAMRPCSASDVTDSTIARMSRWNTTLQSPLRGNSSRWPAGMIRWPAAAPQHHAVLDRQQHDRQAVAATAAAAIGPAIPPTILVSATPSALRCDAVAWPS